MARTQTSARVPQTAATVAPKRAARKLPSPSPLAEDLMERIEQSGVSGDAGVAPAELGQKVLVLQGGGALGAYQGGVFEAMAESGLTPDWVIGTSIGAINAALIAGNRPEDRLARLHAFWRRVEHGGLTRAAASGWMFGRVWADAMVTATGVPGFFELNTAAWFGMDAHLGAERAAFYSTAPLEQTLHELIDFDLLNDGPMRLTVGATNLRTAEMRYFDSRAERVTARHIMASGALPPAFPPVRIDGELYWDGGVLSNTPVEAVFDDIPRRSGLVFAVHMWNPDGPEPDTLAKVLAREKDVRYSSRAVSHIARQKQLHKLRHVISELSKRLPAEALASPDVKALTAYGCTTRMHVVRLMAPSLAGDASTKDIDFNAENIHARWRRGQQDTQRLLAEAPWRGEFNDLEGFILHEAWAGVVVDEPG